MCVTIFFIQIHEDLDSGKPTLRLLYVTPELIATPGFMAKLIKIYSRGLLNLIAIDEVNLYSCTMCAMLYVYLFQSYIIFLFNAIFRHIVFQRGAMTSGL